jgi:hypothetical protein
MAHIGWQRYVGPKLSPSRHIDRDIGAPLRLGKDTTHK